MGERRCAGGANGECARGAVMSANARPPTYGHDKAKTARLQRHMRQRELGLGRAAIIEKRRARVEPAR